MNRIATRRSIVKRALAAVGKACDDHRWLPMLIAFFAAVLVNIVWE